MALDTLGPLPDIAQQAVHAEAPRLATIADPCLGKASASLIDPAGQSCSTTSCHCTGTFMLGRDIVRPAQLSANHAAHAAGAAPPGLTPSPGTPCHRAQLLPTCAWLPAWEAAALPAWCGCRDDRSVSMSDRPPSELSVAITEAGACLACLACPCAAPTCPCASPCSRASRQHVTATLSWLHLCVPRKVHSN